MFLRDSVLDPSPGKPRLFLDSLCSDPLAVASGKALILTGCRRLTGTNLSQDNFPEVDCIMLKGFRFPQCDSGRTPG